MANNNKNVVRIISQEILSPIRTVYVKRLPVGNNEDSVFNAANVLVPQLPIEQKNSIKLQSINGSEVPDPLEIIDQRIITCGEQDKNVSEITNSKLKTSIIPAKKTQTVSPVQNEILNQLNNDAAPSIPVTNADEEEEEIYQFLVENESAICTNQNPKPNLERRILSNHKKRKRNPENWKRTVQKRLRQSGKEYVSVTGRLMAERQVREGCAETCFYKCSEKISDEQRQRIHNVFWSLTDEQKNYFYWKYTSRAPKRRATKKISRRHYTLNYQFEIRGQLIPVCSKFFYSTLDIPGRRVYYFYEHCYQEDTCMPREALRGKNPKPLLPNLNKRIDEVCEHITSFPTRLLPGSTKKLYLEVGVTLTKMYKMYANSVTQPLKKHYYSKIFHENFNLHFQSPKIRFKEKKKTNTKDMDHMQNGTTTVRIKSKQNHFEVANDLQ